MDNPVDHRGRDNLVPEHPSPSIWNWHRFSWVNVAC